MRQIFILPQLTQPIQPNISRFSRYVLFLRRYAKNGTRHSTANWQPRYCPQNLCVCDGAYKSRLDIVKGMASWRRYPRPQYCGCALPDLIAQIDAALADGCEVIALDGAEFSAPEKVLSGIRKEFSSYCCIGGVSDAKNVPVKPSSDSAESVKKCGAKTKASAPQGNTSVARQISVEEPISHPRFPRNYVRRNSKIAKIAAESIGSALREELEPVLDALDDIGAMLSELLSEREIDHAPKQPRGWRKCTVENPLGGVIRTKCGRTSVVVGTRKISKTTTRK